eukprot:2049166-Alexandrium_andersonii.AAC.1
MAEPARTAQREPAHWLPRHEPNRHAESRSAQKPERMVEAYARQCILFPREVDSVPEGPCRGGSAALPRAC